jgi:hypothetical protein
VDTAVNITGNAVNIVDTAVNITGNAVNIVDSAVNITGNAVNIVDTAVNITDIHRTKSEETRLPHEQCKQIRAQQTE